MTGTIKGLAVAALGAVAFMVVPMASAGISTNLLEIEACVGGSCWGYCMFTADDPRGSLEYDPQTQTWDWTLLVDVPILSADQQTLMGTLQSQTTNLQFGQDPSVNLNFAVEAGPYPGGTSFTIKSALLSFPTISNASGRASAAFTLTDGIDEDGATLTPSTGPGSYLAQYNGFVPNGTSFTQLIPQMVADPLGTTSLSQEFPGGGLFSSISSPVSDMSSEVSFLLTPNDLPSGTSVFAIVPEPTGLLLLAVGLGLARRRG